MYIKGLVFHFITNPPSYGTWAHMWLFQDGADAWGIHLPVQLYVSLSLGVFSDQGA